MAFDFKRVAISNAGGEHFHLSPDGMTLNGQPVMFQHEEHVFVKDICIITKKKMKQLISADGQGVIMREEARRVFDDVVDQENDVDGVT